MSKSFSPEKNVFIAGVGFSSKASAGDIALAVRCVALDNNLDLSQLNRLACLDTKRQSKPLKIAAQELGLKLVFIDQSMAKLAAGRCATRSKPSLRATGLPSASEAAALAATGATGRLLAPRTCHGFVTCALAINTLRRRRNQADQPANKQYGTKNDT